LNARRLDMKFGMRKPSFKKSFKARTTGRAKRAIKRALIPGYGKKGMGWIRNPKKAMYNKIYRKTTFSIFDLFK
jgi:hypothetical protein